MSTADDAVERMLGTALFAFARAAVTAGASPTQALRLAAFGVIEGSLGREATRSLGLPEPTARRWRRELAQLDGDAIPDEPPVELFNELLPFMGFPDLRMTYGRKPLDTPPEGGGQDG